MPLLGLVVFLEGLCSLLCAILDVHFAIASISSNASFTSPLTSCESLAFPVTLPTNDYKSFKIIKKQFKTFNNYLQTITI